MSDYDDDYSDGVGPWVIANSVTDDEIAMRWRRTLGLPPNQQVRGCGDLHCVHCSPAAQQFKDSTVDWTYEQRSMFQIAQALIHGSYRDFPAYLDRLRGDWLFHRSLANSELSLDFPWSPERSEELADRCYGWLLAEVLEYLVLFDAYCSALAIDYGLARRGSARPPYLA